MRNKSELKFYVKSKRRTYQVVNSRLFEVITRCFQLGIVYIENKSLLKLKKKT